MKFAVQGVDEYADKLSKLKDRSTGVAKKAVYSAAGIVADAIKASLQGTHTVSDSQNIWNWKKGKNGQLSEAQKKGLLDSLGVARFQSANGYIHTRIGFNGYNTVKTKKYPNGQPNVLIARMLEGGGSTFEAQPFVKKAVNSSKAAALAAMQTVIDRELEAL